MAKDYLTEAFEALKILNEDTFDVNDQGVKELKLFLDQDENLPEEEVVIDPLAETEEDLQDSYEGKVILMCPICQSKIYKAPEEVVISDENVVNIEESCPYCQCNEGYKIIGQVAPFKPEESKEEVETDNSAETSVEVEEKEDVDLDEALGIKRKKLVESEDDEEEITYVFSHPVKIGVKFEGETDETKFFDTSNLNATQVNAMENSSLFDDLIPIEAIPDDFEGTDKLTDDWTWDFYPTKDGLMVDFELSTVEPLSKREIKQIIKGLNSWGKPENLGLFPLEDDFEALKVVPVQLDIPKGATGCNFVFDFYDGKDWIYKTLNEAFCKNKSKKAGKFEGLKNERLFRNKKIKEDFERVDIETDKEKMSMTADENGKVTVTTEPKAEEVEKETQEVIAPLEPKTEDKFQEVDVNEFDEEEFDELGEKYLRQVYENVKSYKTLNGKVNGNTLKLEGLITFKSGKQVKTNFVFEAKSINAKGKVKFLGENKQFAKGKNAFTLSGKISKGKLIAESLNYNYRAKDSKSKGSKRLYGTVYNK